MKCNPIEYKLFRLVNVNFMLNSDTLNDYKSIKIGFFTYKGLMKILVEFQIDGESSFRKKILQIENKF